MKKKRWLAILLAVLAAAGLFYGAGSVFAAGRRKTVVVIPAADINYSYGDYENSMEGMVTTGASQDVYLLDTQTVAEVLVESGQKVREGDVLLKYDATQTAINLDKEILNRDKLDLQLEVAQKNLETLMKIRPGSDGGDIPFIPFPEPVIPEEPELPEVDAAEKLDDDAEAYNQAKDSKEDPLGTEANPYRYLCKEETVITGAFLNKLRQKALDRSGASEDPEKVQPMYFVLEVREGNKSSGRLQKGWIMDAATLEKAPDNWQGSVNLRGDVPKSGSDAKAVSRLDAGAEPYNLSEDSEEDPLGSDTNPYRYLCTADAVITSAFLREAAEKTGPDGTPAYYVLEVREGDRADGELRLSWKRQGAPEGEYKEDGEYKLALTLAEVEKEEPGTDPEEPADPEDPEDPGEGGQGGQPGQGGQEGGDPGTDPGTDTPGGDPGSQEPGQGGGQEGSGTEQPAQEGGSEPAAPAGGTEPAPAPATEEPGTEVTGTAMRGASAKSTTLVMDVTGSQRILFRLADGDTTGLISPDAFYTKEDLEQARQDARRSIQSLQLDLREADINIQAARRALEEGDVKAVMDGTITTVSDPENPPSDGSPFLTLLSEKGQYIESGLNELYLGTVAAGDPVYLTSYMDGSMMEGTIQSISPYPDTSGRFGWGSTSAYYPMIINVTDTDVKLREGDYLEVRVDSSAGSAAAAGGRGKFYLWKAFIRDENGQKYIYKDDGGRLVRQDIRVGGLSGESYEILSGVTPEDYVAFPYGNAVREGAKTRQGTLDELYQ